MHVRPAEPADAEAIARVHVQSHREAYTGLVSAEALKRRTIDDRIQVWRSATTDSQISVAVALDGADNVIGFASTCPSRDSPPVRDTELQSLYVLQRWYGSGAGQSLLDAVLGDRPASLWVLAANPRARAFYVRNGFSTDGVEQEHPGFGNALIVRMVR